MVPSGHPQDRTPKSLLRNPMATSALNAFTEGRFQPVIGERHLADPEAAEQVIMCTGKIYYELLEARQARKLETVAIVRIEQLYPFPRQEFDAMVEGFPSAHTFIWCQEEPQNQGAWDQIKHRFSKMVKAGKWVFYVGRPAAAAPATGHYRVHVEEQQKVIDDALSGRFDPDLNQRMF
jgi:2-oxoglutarate dehydrogenase E1 component